ncbi:MAG: tRNA pseudouridine(55) synthase TruB [Treponema sp.]|jgi:tRNA pseudouridine55 synthase|nr:tRNA pseudouridine(55) synthase TruB [Treponema sp.]
MRAAENRDGLLLLDKVPGITSFDSLRQVKKALNTKKVGHTGTLDKFASGLLVILTGRALRLSPWFSRCNKEYEALIRFGEETDTLDPEGSVIAEAPLPSRKAVEEALPAFLGEILQVPPMYSAIHIGGKRASQLARAGEVPHMKERKVNIYSIRLLSWEPPLGSFSVSCSGGTYIRSLARDLALAAGSRGRLEALRRTRVSGFRVEEALREAAPEALMGIKPEIFSLLKMPVIKVKLHDVQNIIHGKPLGPLLDHAGLYFSADSGMEKTPEDDFCAGLFSEDNSFLALVEKKSGVWSYGFVFAQATETRSGPSGFLRSRPGGTHADY